MNRAVTRRRFVGACCAAAACLTPAVALSQPNPQRRPRQRRRNAKHAGCHPPQGAAAQLQQSTISGFGNAQYDAAFRREVAQQQAFWNTAHPAGIPTRVVIFNEGSPDDANAWASSDGWIAFGYHCFYKHLEHGTLGIDGILAHEFGHRVAQTFGWGAPGPLAELEADSFSAYYLGLMKGQYWREIQLLFEHFGSTGDYHFNDPMHHGTPRQRMAAAQEGLRVAQAGRYSALQLHQHFSNAVQQIFQQR